MAVTSEQQSVANETSSAIAKVTKALALIVSGIAGLFILKLIKVLRSRANGSISEKEAQEKIDQIKLEWFNRIEKSVNDAWTKGVSLGNSAAAKQGVKSSQKEVSKDTVQDLLKDVKRSIDDSDKLLKESFSDQSSVDKITKLISLRQQMTAEASLKYAVAQTMESELASPDTQKMWVSTNPREACSHCTRLHGIVREWGEEFPHSFVGVHKLKVYGGVLLGPLRHPHCRCILIRVPKGAK